MLTDNQLELNDALTVTVSIECSECCKEHREEHDDTEEVAKWLDNRGWTVTHQGHVLCGECAPEGARHARS